MLRSLYLAMRRNPLLKKSARRISLRVKHTVRCPDAYEDLARVIRSVQPHAILDIGSFQGETIARFLEDSAVPIHGFEPSPDTFEKLERHYTNNPLVQLHNLALSDRDGEHPFFRNENPQTNSLLENDEGNVTVFPEYTRHVNQVMVPTAKLDTWVQAYCPAGMLVVKSDVQGAEGLLLAGGEQTFREQVVAFYSEAQLSNMYQKQADLFDLHRQLVSWGFALRNIYPCLHDEHGRAVQTDVLWVRASLMKDCNLFR